jgi:hypothetical protein
MIKHIETKQVAVRETKKDTALRRAAVAAFEVAAAKSVAAYAVLEEVSARAAGTDEARAAYTAYLQASGEMDRLRAAIPEPKTRTVRTQWTEY